MSAVKFILMAGTGYSAEAVALFARMTTQPDTYRKRVIDRCIRRLVSTSVWAQLDQLCVYAGQAEQAALLNWVGGPPNNFDATVAGTLTFTTDRGYSGGGSTANFIDTHIDPTFAARKYGISSATIGVWSRTSAASATGAVMMGQNSTGNAQLNARNTSDVIEGAINNTSTVSLATGVTNGSGFFSLSRTASDLTTLYRNGASIGSTTQTPSGGEPTSTFGVLGRRAVGGAVTSPWNGEVAASVIGGGLTAQQNLDLYNALHEYMQAVGAA